MSDLVGNMCAIHAAGEGGGGPHEKRRTNWLGTRRDILRGGNDTSIGEYRCAEKKENVVRATVAERRPHEVKSKSIRTREDDGRLMHGGIEFELDPFIGVVERLWEEMGYSSKIGSSQKDDKAIKLP